LNGISRQTNYGFPADETGPWTEHEATGRERAIAASDFSVELVRFTDARRARSLEAETPDQLIHQYDPDELMQGLNYRVPNILERYLAYKPRMQKNYKVEVTLTKLLTLVKTGTMWSGSWGRYSVDMELQVIARRDDSTVVMQRTYSLHDEQARSSNLGRGPSKERDRARMYDLTESMMRKICEQIGWDLRQRDARVWTMDRPAPAFAPKFGLDQANGGMQDRNAAPATSAPAAVPEALDESSFHDGSNDQGVQWRDTTLPAVIVPATPVDAQPSSTQPDATPAPDATPQPTAAMPGNDDDDSTNAVPAADEPVDDGIPSDMPMPATPLGDDQMGPRG
jgi:hypothetical protein